MDVLIDTAYYWQKTNQTVSDDNFLGVSSIDGKSWAVGEGGTILYYDGMQWAEQTSNTGDDLFAVSFIDNNTWSFLEPFLKNDLELISAMNLFRLWGPP